MANERVWDVVIVGAGPAGATAAWHLASNGHQVLLLDKDAFPREKVCGDALIPDALGCIERMGLLPQVEHEGHRVDHISAFSPSGIPFEIPGHFITLKRYRFDELLVQHAMNAGAVLEKAKVSESYPYGDYAVVKTSLGHAIRPRVCLLATGANISLTQRNRLVEARPPDAMAIRCYIRSTAQIHGLVFSFDRTLLPGYGWIFPLGNQEFNVGYAIVAGRKFLKNRNMGTLFETFLTSFPKAVELLKHGEITSPKKGAPLRCGLGGLDTAAWGKVLMIGETIGTTFPFSGEGIGKAMESAEIAAEVIDSYLKKNDCSILATYPQLLASRLGPKYTGYRTAEKWLTKPHVGDFIARRANRNPFLQKSLAGIVNETVDTKTVFSLWGLVRALF